LLPSSIPSDNTANLSSAIRLCVLDFYRNQLSEEKPRRDGAARNAVEKMNAAE